MIVDRKRKLNFQTYKIKKSSKFELHLFSDFQGYKKEYNIPLKYGGKLATSVGDVTGDNEKIERYEISFRKLPDYIKEQVRIAIKYIEDNGTPMENDESIYS